MEHEANTREQLIIEFHKLQKRVAALELENAQLKSSKIALQEIEKKNKFLADLIRLGSQPVGVGYPDGRVGLVNRAFEQLTGYSLEELQSIDWAADLTPPEWLPMEQTRLEELHRTGKPVRYEKEYIRKDGARVPVELLVHLITDPDGKLEYYYSYVTDITERKQAEELLLKSERRFRSIMDQAADGILVHDIRGRLLDANQQACQTLGYTKEELVRLDIADIDPEAITSGKGQLWDKIAKGQRFIFESRQRRKDGSMFPVEVTLGPIEAGGETLVLGIVRDITQRKQAEEALRQSEELYRLLAENASDTIWMMRLDGTFTYHSPSVMNLRGYTPEEANQIHLDQTFTPASLLLIHEILLEESEKPMAGRWLNRNEELEMYQKDGSVIWTEVLVRAVRDSEGNVISLQGSTRDISERKRAEATRQQLEAQLFQAQKMEAIGTLAGGIAHDFNNILWAIMGFSELTLSSLPEGSKERWNMQQVLQASERARDLVNQILAFSRKADQEKKPLQIALIVKEALKLLRATIPTTIEIKQTISAPEALVLADPTQLHQIIMNLCTNAAQAMREKGNTLEIGLEEVHLNPDVLSDHQELAPGPYVKLTVRDNGPGIAPESIDKIFDPFFTTKGVGEGTGMGLAMVYGIVKSHGGAITVSSQSGEGAAFTVLLPKIISQESEDQETQASIPKGHGQILLVDDEKMLVEMNKRLLVGLGYVVTPVTSSLEALEIFRAQPGTFDLVLTDQTMPQMDGLKLSREVRHLRPDIPIIICTGFSDRVSKEIVEAAGIDGLLMKPIDLRKLGETVQKVLNKEKQ
jgi:PAS domain S-box-containing protein